MNIFFVFVSDINECTEETDDCTHKCVNTVPGYECVCQEGFILLTSDNVTCIRK